MKGGAGVLWRRTVSSPFSGPEVERLTVTAKAPKPLRRNHTKYVMPAP
jgi:hypothetical protein